MKFIFLVNLFILKSLFLIAQGDTIYVNEMGTHVLKNEAMFYRIVSKDSENLYLFNDYYFNHQLARSVQFTSYLGTIKHGRSLEFDSLGNLKTTGQFEKGFEIGDWNYYYVPFKIQKEKRMYANLKNHEFYQQVYDSATTKLVSEGMINVNGKKAGIWKTYFRDTDIVQFQNQYTNGKKQHEQFEYYISGAIKRKEIYGKYKLDKGYMYTEKGKKVNYYPAFEYPSSKYYLKNYLQKNCNCINTILGSKEIEISFRVEKDGSIKNIDIDIDDMICKAEIKKAMLKMKWKPAKKENVPINFKVKQTLKNKGLYYE